LGSLLDRTTQRTSKAITPATTVQKVRSTRNGSAMTPMMCGFIPGSPVDQASQPAGDPYLSILQALSPAGTQKVRDVMNNPKHTAVGGERRRCPLTAEAKVKTPTTTMSAGRIGNGVIGVIE